MIWDPKLSKSDGQIRVLIGNLPKGLEETYQRCLQRIEEQDPEHREIAAKAFKWMSAVETPLTPRQAREVVSMDSSNVYLQESSVLNASVTEFCANLLTIDLTNRQVLFAHASVKQFLHRELPLSLIRYHLDFAKIVPDWAAVCLAYLDTIRSRKQLIVRQGIDTTRLLPKLVENSLPRPLKIPAFTRFLTRPSTRTNTSSTRVPQASQSNSNATTLQMHDYFLSNWLSLTSNIRPSDPGHIILQRLCRYLDPEVFHWVESKANERTSIYQRITQHATVTRHLPLLRAVLQHLKTHTPTLLKEVLDAECPGTSVRLVHMSAALGYTDVLQELAKYCAVNVFDNERIKRTSIAWAAEKSHFETVKWLLSKARGDRDVCRIGPYQNNAGQTYSVSLLTLLAELDTEDGFVSHFHGPSMINAFPFSAVHFLTLNITASSHYVITLNPWSLFHNLRRVSWLP